MKNFQKGGIGKAESLTNKKHQDKIGQAALEVIESESSTQFSFGVNQMDKLQHKVGVSHTRMWTYDTKETVRNQSQDQQHKSKDQHAEN